MIKLQGKIPRKIYVACSGGVDSMAALDFLRRNHEVTALYFNHQTTHGYEARSLVMEYCREHGLGFVTDSIRDTCPPGRSKEDYWREARYEFLEWFTRDNATSLGEAVITCHHLDDCVETWIWSCMHGTGKIVPYSRGKIIRPFRLTRKRELELWADLKNVPYVQDPSNSDTAYTRNYIRHEMMPHVLKVNPGIYKTVKKKVVASYDEEVDKLGC
mgnify:CR=1 FL=1